MTLSALAGVLSTAAEPRADMDGDRVEFTYEEAQQDSFRFGATRVREP